MHIWIIKEKWKKNYIGLFKEFLVDLIFSINLTDFCCNFYLFSSAPFGINVLFLSSFLVLKVRLLILYFSSDLVFQCYELLSKHCFYYISQLLSYHVIFTYVNILLSALEISYLTHMFFKGVWLNLLVTGKVSATFLLLI
jgi:hypothetical protein